MTNSTRAYLNLLFISLLWGGTFPIIKNAVINIDPFTFVSIRFLLAALLFIIFIIKKLPTLNRQLIISGLILGLLNAATYTTQTIGLKYISASRSAFITGVYIFFVPLIAVLFKIERFSLLNLCAALLCIYGLYILTGSNISHISYGDILTVICALSCAISIVYLQHISAVHPDYKSLCFYQILFTAPVPGIIAFKTGHLNELFHLPVIFAFFYCIIFATIFTLYLQTKYQKYSTATTAALIFSLEPVFATLISIFIYGEMMTKNIMVGGAVMLASVILPELIRVNL